MEAWSSGVRGRIWCEMVCSVVCDSAGSREEEGRDRGGVAFTSPAPPPSLPNRSFLLHHRICPGSSLLSPLSPDRGPRGQRRGGRGTQRAAACGPEDSSPRPSRQSPSSFSLTVARGRWTGWGPPVGARGRGSARRRCPYTFFRGRDS
jgi:hypothetical protein